MNGWTGSTYSVNRNTISKIDAKIKHYKYIGKMTEINHKC